MQNQWIRWMPIPPTIPSAWAGAHISPYLCRCHIHLHNHPHLCRSRRRVPVRTWRRASRTRCGSSALPVPRCRPGSIRSHPAPCACSAASSRTARGCICPDSWRRIYHRDPTRQHLRAPSATTPGSRTDAWFEVLANTTLDAVLGSSALGRSCPLLRCDSEWNSSGCMAVSFKQVCFAHSMPSSVSSIRCCCLFASLPLPCFRNPAWKWN